MPFSSSSKKFLHDYLNNYAPTGYETNGQMIWLDYIRPYIDAHFTDSYGSLVGVVNPEAKYKVVLEAHADEISWCINYIDKAGYIYLIRNGGSDYQIAPSMEAKIHTRKGMVDAVFGWPAIHVRRDTPSMDKLKPEQKTVVLDAGFSSDKEALKRGVHVGCVVTFVKKFQEMNEKYFVGRGLDNRIGGFMIAEVARLLREEKKKLPFGIYFVNAVQEEVGLRGAQMLAARLQPNVALVTDVTHDTQSPLYDKVKEGDISCEKGPVITYAPPVQRNVRELLELVAEKNKISYQRLASAAVTGTDTDAFAYSLKGTPAALISLPLRYMHTTVEMVAKKDVQELIHLMKLFVCSIKGDENFSYFS